MIQRPTIQTSRLLLRPFTEVDAASVQQLAGDREVAATTMNIPHPYPACAAGQWISTHEDAFVAGKTLTLAVALKDDDALIGAISLLNLSAPHQRGELGYWVGRNYWSNGYCTEAALAMAEFGFLTLGLHRVEGRCLRTNTRSARVMEKVGLSVEGCLREHVSKWGRFEDILLFGLLKADWTRNRNHHST
jgi:RimJ/RimL family protein N-acetyltransferase